MDLDILRDLYGMDDYLTTASKAIEDAISNAYDKEVRKEMIAIKTDVDDILSNVYKRIKRIKRIKY